MKLNLYLYIFLFLAFPFIAFSQQVYQPLLEAEKTIAEIDSLTLKLRSKLFPVADIGEENIYGFNEDDVPEYSDSAYKYRLKQIESEIPLDYNQYVKSYIELYAKKKRKLISKVLATSKFYFPVFEEILNRENMPFELKYLAVIESALNQNAVSRAGAVGLWQFIAPTGRMYGLKTNAYFDERREIIKSTEAAVAYLKNSYRIYNDWLLVIASYNCGPGNVNKAIKQSGGKTNFWDIMPYLPKETRGYVPAFVAATYIMNYAAEHNLYSDNEFLIYPHLDTILVDNTLSIEQLALALNISKTELLMYNPSLRKGVIPFTNEKVCLTLPYHYAVRAAMLQGNKDLNTNINNRIYLASKNINSRNAHSSKIVYTVKRGDVLNKIAQKYNVTIAELKQWNRGKIRGNTIQKGLKLNIYPRA